MSTKVTRFSQTPQQRQANGGDRQRRAVAGRSFE
jgi:hypothetical protein